MKKLNKKQLQEIKEIGSRIEESVSAYFNSINVLDPTYNFQWEYILVDNDKKPIKVIKITDMSISTPGML